MPSPTQSRAGRERRGALVPIPVSFALSLILAPAVVAAPGPWLAPGPVWPSLEPAFPAAWPAAAVDPDGPPPVPTTRSEERRVGKEGSTGGMARQSTTDSVRAPQALQVRHT